MTLRPTTETNLSAMKAQMNKTKKKPLKLSTQTKAKQKEVAKKADVKPTVKVSTDVKPKAAKKTAAPKVPFENYEQNIAKLLKVTLKETTNKNGNPIMAGENKNVRLESNRARREMLIKVNGKVAGEVYKSKQNGYKVCVSHKNFAKLNVPKTATVKEHPTWNDIFVEEPSELVSQLLA